MGDLQLRIDIRLAAAACAAAITPATATTRGGSSRRPPGGAQELADAGRMHLRQATATADPWGSRGTPPRWRQVNAGNARGGMMTLDRVIAAMGGTDGPRDVLDGLLMCPGRIPGLGGTLHRGIAGHGGRWARRAVPVIYSAATDPPRRALLTCHSLGCGIVATAAQLATGGLASSPLEVELIAVGTPPFLDAAAADDLYRLLEGRITLVRRPGDPVPALPVISRLWGHPRGRVVTILDDGELVEGLGAYHYHRREALGEMGRWRPFEALRWRPHFLLASYCRALGILPRRGA